MASDAPRTLPEMLARQASLRPAQVALRFEAQSVTYAELAARADRAASVLAHDWQVRAGDRVAWLGLNHPAQLVLLFALARLGAALLPVNVRLAPAEWDALLRSVQPVRLVHDDAFAQAAAAIAARVDLPSHPAAALDTPAAMAPVDAAAPDAAALLVQTSGTTGGPRVAVHTQAHLLANLRIAADVQAITPADRVFTVLPLFHVGGLCIQTLPALSAGATVLLHPRFTPDATFDALAAERPSLTLQVPATMKALVDHPRWGEVDLGCLRAVWAGSSLLPAPLLEVFHAR
ncbi:MAG TPA: AMP-binding protein, partial [Ramlibacter sp.]